MDDKRYRVKFRCPNINCYSTAVEEAMIEVFKFSRITDIIPRVIDKQLYCAVDYDWSSNEGGRVLHYACMSCGYILRTEHCVNPFTREDIPITKSIELFEWLKKHNILEEV